MTDGAVERDQLLYRALGWSLACDRIGEEHGRDLAIGPSGFGVVAGMDCLTQSLEIALTTLQGSHVFDVGFGFAGLSALADESDVALARERLRIAVIDTVRRDPRVRRVIDLDLERGADADPSTPRGTVSVRVSFETVVGEQASIAFGSVRPDA